MSILKENLQQKMKASAIHLLISLVILTLVAIFIFSIWYPSPLLSAVGGMKIFFLMVLIDIILGPLLTFIVYKKNKKTLQFDLSVIAFFQLVALCFALYSLVLAKPVWIVFNQSRFELIQSHELIVEQKPQNSEYLSQNYWTKPKFVAVQLAQTQELREQQMMMEAFGGISLAQIPANYVPIENKSVDILSKSYSMDKLYQFNESSHVDTILAKEKTATSWLPMKAKELDMVVLIDQQGLVVGIVDLRPWR